MEAGYDIDFVAIIVYEMHEREFWEMTTLPFPYLVQLLYDEANVLKISNVDVRVEAWGMAQTSMIKGSANPVLHRGPIHI